MTGRRESRGRVVVVTGASSGIGRATAALFAGRGDRLVLAARHRGNLEEVAAECSAHGAAEVLVVPTDVSVEEQVHALVDTAVTAFGRIDVWVGAASVYSYGTVERTPGEVVRQILETNLLGQFTTARALVPHLRAQGTGTLVVVGSVYSKVTSPYVAPYIASKFGVLGFAEALRQELRDVRGVHVCLVLPATIDTPIYQHAANYTGRRVHPLPPVVSPYRVARTIVRLADHPRKEVTVGQTQRGFIPVHALAPGLYDRCIGPVMDLVALRGGPVPPGPGSVFEQDAFINDVEGGWRSGRARALGLVAGVTAMTVGALTARSRSSSTDVRPPARERAARLRPFDDAADRPCRGHLRPAALDPALLSHFPGDHFGEVAQGDLDHDLPIITIPQSAEQLNDLGFGNTYALETWEALEVRRDDALLRITACPGRHGPGLADLVLPDVMGSVLELAPVRGEVTHRFCISGDTVLYDDLEEIPRRCPDIDVGLVHLGGSTVLGIMVTMDAEQGAGAVELVSPGIALPVHYATTTLSPPA